MTHFTLAVIADERSSPRGVDRSFAPFLGKTMIEYILGRVAGLGQAQTLLVTPHPELYAYLDLPVLSEVPPDQGLLGALHAALEGSASEHILAVGCDRPFPNTDLLRRLLSLRAGPFDVIVPRVKGCAQPVPALYSQACLEPIRERLAARRLKVEGVYDRVRVRYLDEADYARFDPKGLSFFAASTPQELQAVLEFQPQDPSAAT